MIAFVKIRKGRGCFGLLVLLLAAVVPAAGFPQATNPEAATIEQIVVTARKRAESVQDVPIAMSAWSGEEVTNLNIVNIADIAPLAPNLETTDNVGFQNFYIRGLGSQVTIPGYENAVATYIDGVYLARPAAAMLLLPDIERIEILRGPQGTLFGRNATAGVISIVTRAPSEEVSGDFSLSYANEDTLEGRGFLSGALTESLLASVSVVTRDQGDGFGTNLASGNDLIDTDYLSVRAKFLLKVDESFEIQLAPYYNKLDSTAASVNGIPEGARPATANGGLFFGGASAPPANFTTQPRDVYWTSEPIYRFEETGITLTLEKAWTNFELTSISNYSEAEAFIGGDFDTTDAAGWSVAFVPGGVNVPNPTVNFASSYDFPEFFSQELRLASVGDGSLQWVTGIYAQLSEDAYDPIGVYVSAHQPRWSDRGELAIPAYVQMIVGKVETEAYGVFLQGNYQVADRWNLTAGVRYNDETKDFTGEAYSNAGGIPVRLLQNKRNENWSRPTWLMSASYELDNAMLYASYNRGFKSGAFNTSSPTSTTPVDEEVIDAYEAGFKSDWLDDRLRVNGTAFFYQVEDLQFLTISATTGTAILQNAAEAEVQGLELEIAYLPTSGLYMFANLGYLDSEYTEFPNFVGRVPQVDAAGNPIGGTVNRPIAIAGENLIKAPDYTATLGVSYERPLGEGLTLELNLDATREGSSFNDVEHSDNLKVDANTIANANIGVRIDRGAQTYRATLWGRNLTDEDVMDGGGSVFNTQRVRYNDPLTYGLRVSVGF